MVIENRSLFCFLAKILEIHLQKITSLAWKETAIHLFSFFFSCVIAYQPSFKNMFLDAPYSVPHLCPHPSICGALFCVFCFVLREQGVGHSLGSFSTFLFSLHCLGGPFTCLCQRAATSHLMDLSEGSVFKWIARSGDGGGVRDQEKRRAEEVLGELCCILCAYTIRSLNVAPNLLPFISLYIVFLLRLYCRCRNVGLCSTVGVWGKRRTLSLITHKRTAIHDTTLCFRCHSLTPSAVFCVGRQLPFTVVTITALVLVRFLYQLCLDTDTSTSNLPYWYPSIWN